MSTNLWGGAGHNEAHLIVQHKHKGYCMQVEGPQVTDDAKWRAEGNNWAKRHGAIIEDGPCPAVWADEVHHLNNGKTHFKVFMH